MMQKVDGSFTVGHLSSFDPSTYEIVHRYGRPYFIREPSAERDLGEKLNAQVQILPNIPFGLTITVDPTANLSLNDLPMDKMRALSSRHSVLVLQGFTSVNEEDLINKCTEMGEVVYVFFIT